MDMHKLLVNLGLNDNEAKVYLSLLESGPTLVSSIGKKAGINRTTCYDLLERLVKYNLATYASGASVRKKYAAMPPDHLLHFLERRQTQFERQRDELRKQMPEFKMLYKEIERPHIKFFDGIEGVKAIYRETLKSKEEILSIGDCEEWDSRELVQWARSYNRLRAKLKIHERVLIPAGEKTINWFTYYPTTKKCTQYRILPKEKIPYLFYSELNVYEDKVVIVLLKKPNRMGIMITSALLANMLKALFEMAWEATGRTPQ
ncbi:hypothetical protein A3I42_00430 [Candidatus Uhrbacteria bacterium RIFCSPLOWO2_02_FULL_49_11]|uniref:Transcription regulator TrmB N-terminal domain-containing protein n=1 Tax=Candidatus Uhrbacteria bacterium RIFCSPLOWO2_02_FULL_49_11 TaxID=1802409 RepID=A0A1F7VBC1_9BACT|nr:MAG: hypothetical protein A3I42_00430 [Candidatus Uhrbacteria bacterium RIFCSPLOWO2_02_FULL_49_11]